LECAFGRARSWLGITRGCFRLIAQAMVTWAALLWLNLLWLILLWLIFRRPVLKPVFFPFEQVVEFFNQSRESLRILLLLDQFA
jgi:hypothetical protein